MNKMTYVSILLIPTALLMASCAEKKNDAGADQPTPQKKVDHSARLAEIQKNLQELNTNLELYRECMVSEEAKDCTELENKINEFHP